MDSHLALAGDSKRIVALIRTKGTPLLFDMDGVLYSYALLASWLRPLRMKLLEELCLRAGHILTDSEREEFQQRNSTNMGAWRAFLREIIERSARLSKSEPLDFNEAKQICCSIAPEALRSVRMEQMDGLLDLFAEIVSANSVRAAVVTASFSGVADQTLEALKIDNLFRVVISDDGSYNDEEVKPGTKLWELGFAQLTGAAPTEKSEAIVFEDSLKNLVHLAEKFPRFGFVVVAPTSLEQTHEELAQFPALQNAFNEGRLVIVDTLQPLVEELSNS